MYMMNDAHLFHIAGSFGVGTTWAFEQEIPFFTLVFLDSGRVHKVFHEGTLPRQLRIPSWKDTHSLVWLRRRWRLKLRLIKRFSLFLKISSRFLFSIIQQISELKTLIFRSKNIWIISLYYWTWLKIADTAYF